VPIAFGSVLSGTCGPGYNGTVFNGGVIVPTNGNLAVAFAMERCTTETPPTTCTVTGGGVTTWDPVGEAVYALSPQHKMWAFRAQQTTYGASAQVTFTFGVAAVEVGFTVMDFSGCYDDTANNGLRAVSWVGSAQGSLGSSFSYSVTPSASVNRPLAVTCSNDFWGMNPKTGWTELADWPGNLDSLHAQWNPSAWDQDISVSSAGSNMAYGGFGLVLVAPYGPAEEKYAVRASPQRW
jgi:hypothetical protein